MDFESAIEVCGFGLFNIVLLALTISGSCALMYEITTMSYALPAATCDLDLTLSNMGTIQAMTFAGTFLSALPFGFLADVFGRKLILVYAFILLGIVTICSAFSRSVEHLMIFKFIGGILVSGPVAAFVAYVCEFHGRKHRFYVVMFLGLTNCIALLLMPIKAVYILPLELNYTIFNTDLLSWRIFIAISGLPALITGIAFIFFPESPKFLMSQGYRDKAMKAFQKIYAVNKCKHKDTYPVADLLDEAPEKTQQRIERELLKQKDQRSKRKQKCEEIKLILSEGLGHDKLLFSRQYVFDLLISVLMFFILFMSMNTVRLVLPQIFVAIEEMGTKSMSTSTTCHVLDYIVDTTKLSLDSSTSSANDTCKVIIEPESYTNNIIIGAASVICFILTTVALRCIGNNLLLQIFTVITGISLLTLYWSTSEQMTLILACVYLAFGMTCLTLMLNACINSFPTANRTMALIIILSLARVGGLIGNLLLPFLMALHCIAMFLFFAGALIVPFVLTFFLKNTAKEALI